MRPITVVFTKELIDNLRDRRSVFSTVGYALLGPAMILLMIVVLGSMFREAAERPLELPIAGQEYAPALVHFLEQSNVTVVNAPDDPHDAVRQGDADVVLIIPEDFGEDFSAGRPAAVQIVGDSSRTSAMQNVRRAQSLVEQYSRQTGALRLLARGISPTIITAVSVDEVDVSAQQSEASTFLNLLPYFLVMLVFMGGSSVIIDATAGERERNSLEPLLINPIERWKLVVGKLLVSLPFSTITVLVSLGAFALVFNVFPIERYMGTQVSVDGGVLARIFLLCLPMTLLAGALQMIIATFTRTYKEAQSYVNWLPLIPALPGMVLAFLPVKATISAMLIPTYGQQMLINQLIRGEVVTTMHVVVSTVATLVWSALLVFIAIRLYNREDILFGRK